MKEVIDEGEERRNTSFDNELLNHPYWKKNNFSMKKSAQFGKCDILKDSSLQFELIRSYTIIFGKWHLSIDERIFFLRSGVDEF